MVKVNKKMYICKDINPSGKNYITNKEILKELKEQRSKGDVSQARAALLKDVKWPEDIKVITCKFLEGRRYQKAWVEKLIKEEFEPYVGLKFVFSEKHETPFVTITFDRNKGTYSYVGTECLEKKTVETMNLSWIDPPGDKYGGEFEWKGITYKIPANEPRNGNNVGGSVLHEFGHVIGLVHEHQNPHGNQIKWDKPVCYEFFSGPPNNWTKEDIDKNILDKYDEDQLNATEYDPRSIMLYYYPPEITTDHKGTTANYKLSPIDKLFMLEEYPAINELGQVIKDLDNANQKGTIINGTGEEQPKKKPEKPIKEGFVFMDDECNCPTTLLLAIVIFLVLVYLACMMD